jgi:hypothetical protein
LAPLVRYVALVLLGFHDTSFGDHVEVGLHAVVAKHREETVPLYDPPNLPARVAAEKIASLTGQERKLLERDT